MIFYTVVDTNLSISGKMQVVKRRGETVQDPFGLGSLALNWATPRCGEPRTQRVFCFLGAVTEVCTAQSRTQNLAH